MMDFGAGIKYRTSMTLSDDRICYITPKIILLENFRFFSDFAFYPLQSRLFVVRSSALTATLVILDVWLGFCGKMPENILHRGRNFIFDFHSLKTVNFDSIPFFYGWIAILRHTGKQKNARIHLIMSLYLYLAFLSSCLLECSRVNVLVRIASLLIHRLNPVRQ